MRKIMSLTLNQSHFTAQFKPCNLFNFRVKRNLDNINYLGGHVTKWFPRIVSVGCWASLITRWEHAYFCVIAKESS